MTGDDIATERIAVVVTNTASQAPIESSGLPLVSTEWIAQHAGDADVRIVEVDVDTTLYDEKGHLPNAIVWNWTTQLNDQVARDIVSREDFEKLLSRSGITPDTTVILYGDHNNWFAAYALWLLDYYGHANAKLVDGGRRKWEAEARPFTTETPRIEPTQYRIQQVREELRARRDDVLRAVKDAHAGFVDVRSPDEFTGKILAPPGMSETAQRGGHIPGALNVPWAQTVREDGTFRPIEELEKLYAPVLARDEVVTYCRIGERSSHSWFVLKRLLNKENVRNYDGSWTEYGNLIGAPIEKTA